MGLTVSNMNTTGVTDFIGASLNGSSNVGINGLSSILADYTSIKSGSYGKLIKQYYAKGLDEDAVAKSTADSTSQLAKTKTDADELVDAAKAFTKSDSDLFKKKEITDSEGNKVKDYDKDAIYSAVKDYVEAYNDMLTTGGKSNSTAILTQTASLVNNTSNNANSLGRVGITVGSNNKLSIDESYFKNKADMNTVKSLFSGTGSYIYQQQTKAELISGYAKSDMAAASGYNNSGKYNLSASDVIGTFSTTT